MTLRTKILSLTIPLGLAQMLFTAQGQTQNLSNSTLAEARVLITALDKQRKPLGTLLPGDFKVIENGDAQQITSVQPISNAAISLALIIDVSISQERTLDAQKLAATSFLNSVIEPHRDRVAVVSFTNTVHFDQQPTSDLSRLVTAIAQTKIARPSGPVDRSGIISRPRTNPATGPGSSAIWDAVKLTCEGWRFSPDANMRRAIILLTDGQDTSSKSTLEQAVECVDRKGIAVYTIGIGDNENYNGVDSSVLRQLAKDTGGIAYFPKKVQLSEKFDEIAGTLRNYYVLTYATRQKRPNSKLQIQTVNPVHKGVELFYARRIAH